MRVLFSFLLFVVHFSLFSQETDYTKWSDIFSYNNVEDVLINDAKIYARTDNALFLYDLVEQSYEKISVASKLSTQPSSAMVFSNELKILCVGFENGLLQLIDENLNVNSVYDIILSEISIDKKINSLYIENNDLYMSMNFGIVVFDISKNEFRDTFYIGENSSEVSVNSIVINEGLIYAASDTGIYTAAINSNLSDISNWNLSIQGSYSGLHMFEGSVVAFKDKSIYKIEGTSVATLQKTINETIVSIAVNGDRLNVASASKGYVYDTAYILQSTISGSNINAVVSDETHVFAATGARGVLKYTKSSSSATEELHPSGPVTNSIFSISEKDGVVWFTYGAYDQNNAPQNKRMPLSHFNGDNWVHIPYSKFSAKDLVDVKFDPSNSSKVYVNSWSAGSNGIVASSEHGGLLHLENDERIKFWHADNSGLSVYKSGNYITTRFQGPIFDSKGNFWFANTTGTLDSNDPLRKKSPSGEWSSFPLLDIWDYYYTFIIDKSDNIYIGSRREGLFIVNEVSPNNMNVVNLKMGAGQGNLPGSRVNALAIDANQKLWIGTKSGIVTFDDIANVFSGSFKDAEKVTVVENGIVNSLLDGADINDIYIDGADNKWIGTVANGVYQLNAQSNKVLNVFNTDNSPLPSNNILKILQKSDGITYFLTTKGLVTFDSEIISYGSVLDEVYGYPNPVLKQHHEVTIVGKDGAFLPDNTKVDVFDVTGNLVFSANTSTSLQGGKIVWDKKNLNGVPVASGVYVVLLYDAGGNQTSSTKIAIVN
jgi:hypothetical protein